MISEVNSEAALRITAALLHDARFSGNEVWFDSAKGEFKLKCWQAETAHGGNGSNFGLWKAYQLCFSSVIRCDLTRRETVSYYELATLQYDAIEHTLCILTHYGMGITLRLKAINGTLTHTNETKESWD